MKYLIFSKLLDQIYDSSSDDDTDDNVSLNVSSSVTYTLNITITGSTNIEFNFMSTVGLLSAESNHVDHPRFHAGLRNPG